MKQTLFLIRGLPGSGKTTLAHKITTNVFSADDYFMKDGVYKYDLSRIKQAHEQCQKDTKECLEQGWSQVAVANTFSRRWEMTTYYMMKTDNIEVTEITVNFLLSDDYLFQRCVHGVPLEVIKAMRARWEI